MVKQEVGCAGPAPKRDMHEKSVRLNECCQGMLSTWFSLIQLLSLNPTIQAILDVRQKE